MSSSVRRAIALVSLCLVLLTSVVVGRPAQSALATDAGTKVTVTVSCTSNPEKIMVKNNTGSMIRVTAVGSL